MEVSRVLTAAGVLAATVFLPPAFADTGPWYVGAGVGATRYGVPSGDDTFVHAGEFSPSAFTATTHTDNSATAFRLDAGYRFNRYLALEASYADFGSADSSFTSTSPDNTYAGHTKISGEGLGAVGFLPLTTDLELFGRAGLFHFKSRVNDGVVDVVGLPGSQTVLSATFPEHSTIGTTGFLGAGADYALSDGFSLRAAWDYFRAKDYGEMVGVHLVSIELLYGF